jgi:hypothetical protein
MLGRHGPLSSYVDLHERLAYACATGGLFVHITSAVRNLSRMQPKEAIVGRFSQTIQAVLDKQRAKDEKQSEAREAARKAVLPLYEKVMPVLNDAKAELGTLKIEVDFDPRLEFDKDADKEDLLFRLRPASGKQTPVYRFSYNPKKRLFWAIRHDLQTRKPRTLTHGPINDVTENDIVDIVNSAILEATETDEH